MAAEDALIVRYRNVTAGQVSDGLARTGLSPIGLAGIRPLEPATPFAGRAFTVQFEGLGTQRARVEYLEFVQPGDVIVVANDGRTATSSWGGQRSIGARQKGAVATVAFGCYRDVDELRRVGHPVYGLGPTVAGSAHGAIPVAVNVPVEIAGTRVEPGDVVVGDSSGVIVVPRDHAEQVLRAAEILAEQEQKVTEAVALGEEFLSYRANVRASDSRL